MDGKLWSDSGRVFALRQYVLYLKKSEWVGLIEEDDGVISHLGALRGAWVTANLADMWDKTVSSSIRSLREPSGQLNQIAETVAPTKRK